MDIFGMNTWGVILSYVFVFGVIGVAQLFLKSGVASPSATRKFVHIGVAHWWLLAMVFFDSWLPAIIGPVTFVFINLGSYLFRLFPAMEHEERTKNLGTIYFPVALLINVLLTFAGAIPVWMGGMGILVLGYGDGLASLVGERARSREFRILGNRKSVAGTIVMFVASAAVAAIFIGIFGGGPIGHVISTVVIVAAAATAIEFLTPFGLDNLTVPILTMLIVYWIW